jgi:hypothetical protein
MKLKQQFKAAEAHLTLRTAREGKGSPMPQSQTRIRRIERCLKCYKLVGAGICMDQG